jgi:hypothetical protein
MPAFLLDLGAKLGDLANRLGWMPPMRSTAIAELRRGVTGDPARWMAATGIVPKTHRADGRAPRATIQDKWFRAAVPGQGAGHRSLVLFWIVSGFIALVISYDAAAESCAATVFRRGWSTRHDRHQPDGHEHRRADRVPPHRGVGLIAGIVARSAIWSARRS